jgi:hypothetical protein
MNNKSENAINLYIANIDVIDLSKTEYYRKKTVWCQNSPTWCNLYVKNRIFIQKHSLMLKKSDIYVQNTDIDNKKTKQKIISEKKRLTIRRRQKK